MKCGLESSGLADDFSPLQHTRALTGANTHTQGAGVGTSQTPRTRGGPWPANQPLPAPTLSTTVLPDNVLPSSHSNSPRWSRGRSPHSPRVPDRHVCRVAAGMRSIHVHNCHVYGWIKRIPGAARENDGLETGNTGLRPREWRGFVGAPPPTARSDSPRPPLFAACRPTPRSEAARRTTRRRRLSGWR